MRIFVATLLASALALAGGAEEARRLLAKGDFAGAEKAARAATEEDPAIEDAWLALADAEAGLDRPKDAWSTLEDALGHHPDSVRVYMKLGDLFTRLGEEEQAAQGVANEIVGYYLDAERMYGEALARDPKCTDAVYGQAAANHAVGGSVEGRAARAKELVAQCLAIDPKHGRATALQAFILYGEKKYADAQRQYELAVKLDDSDALTFVRWGHCAYALGDFETAKKAYLAGLARHPDNNVPIVSGLFYLAQRNWSNMAPFTREAVAASPKSFHAWYYHGYSLFVADQVDEALAAFRKADAIRPGDANVLFYAGYSLEKKGDAAGALEHYRKALRADGEHADACARFEALIIARQDNIDDAEKLYEELIALAPGNGWIHNNYALLLRNWGERQGGVTDSPPAPSRRRLKRSGEVYEAAARLLADQAQVQSDTGLLFEFYPCNRDDGKARDYFARALELSEYVYRDAFDGLLRLCRRTGDWETLRDYAEGVVGSIDRGNHAIAPVMASEPKPLPNETPGLLARARAALAEAEKHLKGRSG